MLFRSEDGVVTGNGSVTIDIESAITNAAFGLTNAPQFYTVPAGVSELAIRLYGAGSGGAYGDIVYGRLPVTAGQIIQLNVGGRGWADARYAPAGISSGDGGWNGGGNGQIAAPVTYQSYGGGGVADRFVFVP